MPSLEILQRDLDAEGHEIFGIGVTTAGSATHTDNSTSATSVGTANAPGSSLLASPADHVHQGLHSVKADSGASIFGDLVLVSGTGITLVESGQNITINAAAATTSNISLNHDGAAYVKGTTESIVREMLVNFNEASASSIKVMIAAIVKATAGNGTYNVYTGATAPGSTTGGTIRATITTSSTTDDMQENLGTAFTNPAANKLIQVTAVNSGAGNKSYIRGITMTVG